MTQGNPSNHGMAASALTEPEVKFVTPNNDLFYSAGLYQRLRTDKQEIRLLRLLPGPLLTQVQCEIVDGVFLSEQPQEYHALSYCAGDALVVETIKVQTIDFNVFRNLGAGLRKIRKTDEPLWVWIDQICINQKDVDEREEQVQMMRSIYASASKTILWLGEEQCQTECLAVSFLQTLCERARAAQLSEYGETQDALSKAFQIMRELNPELHLPNDTPTHASNRTLLFNTKLMEQQSAWLFGELKNGNYNEELAAIATMYQVPWWTRSWVFQEAIVSKSADVVYGNSTIDFEAVRLANGVLTLACRSLFNFTTESKSVEEMRMQEQNLLHLSQINGINELIGLEEKWKTRPNLQIRELLNVSRRKDSTDPKDRVYAMLGLMDPKYNVKPIYSPSYTAAQSFVTATKAAIQHDGVLDILADGHEFKRNHSFDLPSWVPDFSITTGHFPMCNWEHEDGKSKFDASLHTFFDEQPLFPTLPQPKFLPDKSGRPDRILRCVMLDLSPVALQHSIDSNPEQSQSLDNAIPHYHEIVTAAGLKDVYPSTIPETADAKPDPPLDLALMQTLGCGALPADVVAGDRHVGFGDIHTKTTFFMDRVGEVLLGRCWRFFITPDKIMGVAPAAAQWDDTLCLLMGASVPFVLRRIAVEGGEGHDYTLVGPAYLHGYMSGQAIVQIFKRKREAVMSVINLH